MRTNSLNIIQAKQAIYVKTAPLFNVNNTYLHGNICNILDLENLQYFL